MDGVEPEGTIMMKRFLAALVLAAAVVAVVAIVFGTRVREPTREMVALGPAPDPTSTQRAGTLDELHARLSNCSTAASGSGSAIATSAASTPPRCLHLVYLWSPGMPLSEKAMPEITLAAEAMGVPLTFLPAEALNRASPVDEKKASALRTALVNAGATVHYPSIVLFDSLEARGNAVVGHKRAQGYRALLEPRLAAAVAEDAMPVAPLGPREGAVMTAREPGDPVGRAASPEADIEILWRQTMVPPPGFFFRRAPGTRYVSYDQRRKVILQHLDTGEKLVGPGFIDFVPTPDGALFVTPSHDDGLEFYVASHVFREARAGRGDALPPIFRDREMDDQYPTVGILAHEEGVSTTYRILVSWFEGLALREYRVDWGDSGSATVTPLTPRIDACAGSGLSIPILSKDGQEIAARDESTGTTKIFRYHEDGGCTESFDFGIQTSKVSFTDDGRIVAFSSPDEGQRGSVARARTYVYNRDTGVTTEIPFSESRGLMIPEFFGPDSLLFIVTEGRGRGTQEFRLVCCVR